MPSQIQCRFCLEAEDHDDDPLLSPCECKGSVEFVHWKCLKRWVLMETSVANRDICSICKTPFASWAVPKLEQIPYLDIIAQLIFHHSGTYGIVLQYFFLLNMRQIGDIDFRNNVVANMNFTLTLVHIVYAMFFLKYFRVTNWGTYFKALAGSSLLPLLACHAICLFYIYCYDDKLCCLPIYLMFNVYWKEHVQILKLINRVLLTP